MILNAELVSWTEAEPQTAITNQTEDVSEKNSDKKEYKESKLEKQHFEEQV